MMFAASLFACTLAGCSERADPPDAPSADQAAQRNAAAAMLADDSVTLDAVTANRQDPP